jgi:hypothetical protein
MLFILLSLMSFSGFAMEATVREAEVLEMSGAAAVLPVGSSAAGVGVSLPLVTVTLGGASDGGLIGG